MFKSIRIKNFLSLVDAEIPLENLGLVLIDGENHCNFGADSNGSGKSSIFEAILWVLYEETVRGFSKDEVIRHGSTGCFVELWFGEYSFLRARRDDQYGTGFFVYKGESRVSFPATKALVACCV